MTCRSTRSTPNATSCHEPRRYTFELERRDFIRLFGGGLLVLVAAPTLSRRNPDARARRAAPTSPGSCRVAAHRRVRPRHGLHRQSRNRPEHPHVAGADSRRRAARAARVDHHGDGRHRPHAVRHGYVRVADDATDGAAAGPGRSDRARDADRSGGRALAARLAARCSARDGRVLAPDGRSISLRRADQRAGAVGHGPRRAGGGAARPLDDSRHSGEEGGRPRLRHRAPPVHARHRAARTWFTAASFVRTDTAQRSSRSTTRRAKAMPGVSDRPRRRLPRRRRADRARGRARGGGGQGDVATDRRPAVCPTRSSTT